MHRSPIRFRPASAGPVLGAILALVTALPALAADPVEAVNLGDTVTGTVEAGVKEILPFNGLEGTLLDVDVTMAPGSGPNIFILQPDRSFLPGLAAFVKIDSKSRKLTGRKIPIIASGRHYLVVFPAVPGAYKARIKGKLPKKVTFEGFILPTPPKEIPFGGQPGSLLSVKVKRAKRSSLEPLVAFVEAPGGGEVDLGAAAKHTLSEKQDAYTNIPLDDLGTYVLGVSTQSGFFGDVASVLIKVKAPKVAKAARLDTEVIVDPLVDAVQPAKGFDNLSYEGILVSGDFFALDPQVKLVGESAVIPATGVLRGGDTQLFIDVDLSGRPPGVYDVVVTLPGGGEGTLAGAFQVLETPLPDSLAPAVAFDNRTQAFTLTGTRFQSGMSVAVLPTGGGTPLPGTLGAISPVSATVSLPLLNFPLGTHDLLVTNPDGGQRILPGALEILTGPRLATATPLLGHDNEAARSVSLTGSQFQEGMTVTLRLGGQDDIPGVVTGLTGTTAGATFDLRGAAPGGWALEAVNPDGGSITPSGPFVITRAPRITSLDPARGVDGEVVSGLEATGSFMVPGAQVTLEQAAATTAGAGGEGVFTGGTAIQFEIDLTDVPSGTHDLRVVNPDGGSEILPGAFNVLGRAPLVSGASGGGSPSFAYSAARGEYLAAWSVFDGSQWDVRVRRFSAETGLPVSAELALTDTANEASGTESQTEPCVAYSPFLDLYLVMYAWSDPSGETNTVGIRGQFVKGDATGTDDIQPQSSTLQAFNAAAGEVSPPRIVWNPTDEQWMIVWAWDASSGGDVHHLVLHPLNQNGLNTIHGQDSAGVLVSTSHTVGLDTIPDAEYDPDVSYSSWSGEYLVTWTYDFDEAGSGSDTGTDVRAAFIDADFSGGVNVLATLTNLGNVSGVSEGHSRIAYYPDGGQFLVVWDQDGVDVRAQLLLALTRAKTGALHTIEDAGADPDASRPCVAFDATPGQDRWLVGYAIDSGVPGSSAIERAACSTDLSTKSRVLLAPAVAGAAFSGASIAARGTMREHLTGWSVTGAADQTEMKFSK